MEFFTIFLITIAIILIYWMYWRWTHRDMLRLAAMLPGPPALPIIGNALLFMTHPEEQLNIIAGLIKKYGDYARFWLGPDLMVCVKDPADIRLLLTSNKVNQKGPAYDFMVPFIGKGILTGGPNWRYYRKIATPSYNKRSIDYFNPIFNEEARQLARGLCCKDDQIFNVYYDVLQCTTRAVCRTLMGLKEKDINEIRNLQEVVLETQNMYTLMFAKMTKWWLQIPLIFRLTGHLKTQNDYLKIVDEMVTDIVEKRREDLSENSEDGVGIVDRFILSGLPEDQVKLETFALFTTSQEASAKIASGVLLFLAHLPDWQKLVYEEIVEVIGELDCEVSEEQLKKLQYLDMVYKEVLRYLSIAALIQRTVEETVTIDKGRITLPPGTVVVIPIHDVHRDPRFWTHPDKVSPGRFAPGNTHRDTNAFIPFSLGAMDCLGRVYATTLIKTIVVTVLRQVELSAEGKLEDLDLHVAISVKFAKGYNLRVRPRNTTGKY